MEGGGGVVAVSCGVWGSCPTPVGLALPSGSEVGGEDGGDGAECDAAADDAGDEDGGVVVHLRMRMQAAARMITVAHVAAQMSPAMMSLRRSGGVSVSEPCVCLVEDGSVGCDEVPDVFMCHRLG